MDATQNKPTPVVSTAGNAKTILTLPTVRDDINMFLEDHFRQQTARAANLHSDYKLLWEATTTQFEAGGKRFRPFLCVLVYQILGGSDYKNIVPIASALELLHIAVLMHDDIIDRDYTRHAKPNLAGTYRTHYGAFLTDEAEATHFAHGAAILAGDLLISDAYQLIINSPISAEQRLQTAQLLGEAVYDVSAGELLDTEAAFYPPDYADSLKIAELKTAFYTCSIPMAIGATLAGADATVIGLLRHMGSSLGIAFQMADDLLGVFGSERLTGKTTVGDLREGKRTYLLQRTLHLTDDSQKLILESIVGNHECNDAMVETARQMMIDCGARAEIEALMVTYVEQANSYVAMLPIEEAYKDKLRDFIDQAVWRNS